MLIQLICVFKSSVNQFHKLVYSSLLVFISCNLLATEYAEPVSAKPILTTQTSNPLKQERPKNIIMVIADGMGPAYTTAFRYFNDNQNTEVVEQTIFDKHLKGLSSTYPAPISGYVTDSAAAATALATGVKTYNKAISVDTNKKPLLTVLEWAKHQGKKTGVVVTSNINHATPAAYLSHNEHRNNYDEIADSYIDQGIKADLYFGGGWKYFIREDRNLVAEYKQAGFQYIDNYSELHNLSKNKPVIGLFGDYALPWALDDVNNFRLSTLVKTATQQLENENGYFMLVEASMIDWAGHDNDIATAMHEVNDLAKAMIYLEDYVNKQPNTLVILTADHSTGGLTVATDKDYRWEPDILRNMKHTPDAIAHKISNTMNTTGDINRDQINEWLNFTLMEKEFTKLRNTLGQYEKEQEKYQKLSDIEKQEVIDDYKVPSLQQSYRTAILRIIDKRTNTGWTTEGHTGIDVPVFSFGKHSELFSGQLDNTDIAKKIFMLLGK